MTESAEDLRDATAMTIHADLLSWLQDTAKTATSAEDLQDLAVGAVAGLAQYFWEARRQGATRHDVVSTIASMAATVIIQLPDQRETMQ